MGAVHPSLPGWVIPEEEREGGREESSASAIPSLLQAELKKKIDPLLFEGGIKTSLTPPPKRKRADSKMRPVSRRHFAWRELFVWDRTCHTHTFVTGLSLRILPKWVVQVHILPSWSRSERSVKVLRYFYSENYGEKMFISGRFLENTKYKLFLRFL